MYTQITNPMTNRKVSIFSKTGQKILNGYVSNLFGGSNTDDVSLEGTFMTDEPNEQPNAEPVQEPVSEPVQEPAPEPVDAMAPTEDVPGLLNKLTEQVSQAATKISNLTSELASCKAASGDSSTQIEELNSRIKTLQDQAVLAAETAVAEGKRYTELKAQEGLLIATVKSAIDNIQVTSETVTSEP